MKIVLDPLPPKDGALFFCSMHTNLKEWPFISRCKNQAAGLLSQADYTRLVNLRVNLSARAICQEHVDAIEQGEA